MYRVLSLGAGVQSTTVLLLSIRGQLPKLDHAIFSDTGWEPPEVYEHLDWLKTEAARAGVPLHVVGKGNIKEDALNSMVRGTLDKKTRWASMPYYVNGPEREGMIRRQCTREYKIDPIEKCIREQVLGLKPRQRAPKEPVVEQWIGISYDELTRMKESLVRWKIHQYPLIGMPKRYLGRPWTRQDCINWLTENYPGRYIPRSACIGCPFHSDREWRDLKERLPEVFEEACKFDEAVRKCGGMKGDVYLHRSCKPLREVDLRTDEDAGQLNFFNQECEGMCGV